MRTITDSCLFLGKTVYTFQMRFFWIPIVLWLGGIALFLAWSLFLFDLVVAIYEIGGGERIFGDAIVITLPSGQAEGCGTQTEILLDRFGMGVSVRNEHLAISPDNPMFFLLPLFPIIIWLFLGWFTVGEKVLRSQKNFVQNLLALFSLVLPWTISREFHKRQKRFLFPFRTEGKRHNNFRMRRFLFSYYVGFGIGATLFALHFEYPRAALFFSWLFGGLFLIVYSALFHALAVAIFYRKSRLQMVKVYTCAASHACIGGLVYPIFPLASSILLYGISSPALIWTLFWIPLVFLFTPVVAGGYIATFIAIFRWLFHFIAQMVNRFNRKRDARSTG